MPPPRLKRSNTAAAVPASLEDGEIAINQADGRLYYRTSVGGVGVFAPGAHTHSATEIVSGTLSDSRLSANVPLLVGGLIPSANLPAATGSTLGGVIVGAGLGVASGTVSVTYGSLANTACQGNDSRLSDARTPLSHTHTASAITDFATEAAKYGPVTSVNGLTGAVTVPGVSDGNKGDITVTGSGATWTINASAVVTADIANNAVTYAKIQNVSATDRLLGRFSAGAGVVEEITCTAAGRALIDDVDAAAQRTTLGLSGMATQPASSVAITGGTINGVPIGATVASTASFTTLSTGGDVLIGTVGTTSGGARLLDVINLESTNAFSAAIMRLITNNAAGTDASAFNVAKYRHGGVFLQNTDTHTDACIAITVGASERMRITSSGNVGIGTASPAARLHVSCVTADDFMYVSGASGRFLQFRPTASQGDNNGMVQANDSAIIYAAGAVDTGALCIVPWATATCGVRMTSAGRVGIGVVSPAVPLDVSGSIRTSTGILFGTDTAAANTLSDYEEGTWTPAFTSSGTSPTVTYASGTAGSYTKIGRIVFAVADIVLASLTAAGTGNLRISGLPFSAPSTFGTWVSAGVIAAIADWSTHAPSRVYVESGTAYMLLTRSDTASSDSFITVSNLTGLTRIRVAVTYHAA